MHTHFQHIIFYFRDRRLKTDVIEQLISDISNIKSSTKEQLKASVLVGVTIL